MVLLDFITWCLGFSCRPGPHCMLDEFAYLLLAKSNTALDKWVGHEQDLKFVRASCLPGKFHATEALENKKRRLVNDKFASLGRTARLTRSIMSLRMLVPNSESPSIEIRTPLRCLEPAPPPPCIRRQDLPAESKQARLELHNPAPRKLRVKRPGSSPQSICKRKTRYKISFTGY